MRHAARAAGDLAANPARGQLRKTPGPVRRAGLADGENDLLARGVMLLRQLLPRRARRPSLVGGPFDAPR